MFIIDQYKFGVPYKSDLDTWHKTITGNIFAESIEGLDAKFLPRVAEFNGTDDKVTSGSNVSFGTGVSFTIICKIKTNSIVGGDAFFIDRPIVTPALIHLFRTSDAFTFRIRGDNSEGLSTITKSNVLTADQWFTAVCVRDVSTDKIKLSIDGDTYSETNDDTTSIIDPVILIGSNQNGNDAWGGSSVELYFYDYAFTQQQAIDYSNGIIPDDFILGYNLTGQGDYEYDISGNENHGTWAGTGGRFDYDLEGSLYAAQNGYSLWEHATSDPIQVPFDINGLALSLTAGIDIPIGYTKTRDVAAGGSKWNIADSLVSFVESVINNGNFKADTNWTKAAGMTIVSEKAVFVGVTSNADLSNDIELVQGQLYRCQLTITDHVEGGFRFKLGGVASDTISSNGMFTRDVTCGFVTDIFQIEARGVSNTYKVSNISVIPITEPFPLEIFDRSNVTRQTAVSRAADNYDAANPYRYQVNEIADPRIYDTFFEAAYKDRIFARVMLAANDDPIRYDEQSNYATQKTGNDLVRVLGYNRITDIYP